jgi:hypothetical protein
VRVSFSLTRGQFHRGDRRGRYCETQIHVKEEMIYHGAESYIEIHTRDEVLML